MRILHVAPRLSALGGADRCLLAVLEGQVGRHDVHLAVGREDPGVCAPCRVTRVKGLAARGAAPAPLEELADALHPDVVHVHHVVNPTALAWAAARGAIVSVQDHRVFCPGRGKWRTDDTLCREVMGRATCAGCFEDPGYFAGILALTQARRDALAGAQIVAPSRYVRSELAQAGLPAQRLHVVAPFVHGLDPAAAPDGEPCVLFAGRLVRAKGPLEAVEAWRRSQVALPLVFAGAGPWAPRLEAAGFPVLGWLDRARMSATYARAAALLLPSRWQEPFGLVGLEALAMGVPVVAWDAGGVAEWHPGPGLVPWGDVEGLAVALRAAVGRRASLPAGFSPRRALERLEEVYAAASAAAS